MKLCKDCKWFVPYIRNDTLSDCGNEQMHVVFTRPNLVVGPIRKKSTLCGVIRLRYPNCPGFSTAASDKAQSPKPRRWWQLWRKK